MVHLAVIVDSSAPVDSIADVVHIVAVVHLAVAVDSSAPVDAIAAVVHIVAEVHLAVVADNSALAIADVVQIVAVDSRVGALGVVDIVVPTAPPFELEMRTNLDIPPSYKVVNRRKR